MHTKAAIILILTATFLICSAPSAPAAGKPDLSMVSVLPTSANPTPGKPLIVAYEVTNTGGSVARNFKVALYLSSAQDAVTGSPLSDALVMELAPGATHMGRFAVRMPATMTPNQWLVAVADAGSAVTEANEANNLLSQTLSGSSAWTPPPATGQPTQPQSANPYQTQPPATPQPTQPQGNPYYDTGNQQAQPGTGGPDVAVTAFSVAAKPYTPGATVPVSYEIKNVGGQPTDIFYLSFCVFDAAGKAGPENCLDRVRIDSMEPGTARSGQSGMWLSPDIKPGQHTLGVIADYDDTVSEENEANNTATAVIQVGKDASPY